MRRLLIIVMMIGFVFTSSTSCQKDNQTRLSIYDPLVIINHLSVYSTHIQKRLDRIDFEKYEMLIRDYGMEIPVKYINKFLKINESKIEGKSNAIGIGVAFYAKRYKLFFLKQGDGQRAQWVMVTYNHQNKQIDEKTFLYYCRSCRKNDLLTLYTLDPKKENEFVIHYYYPTNSKAEPCLDNIDVIKKEKWVIDSNGIFICQNNTKNLVN